MMKAIQTVKTSLFTLMLTFFATGAFANEKEVMKKENVKQAEKSLVFETWVFNGTDPTNSSHYQRDNPANPAPCPLDPETICKISAPADATGDQPDMSAIVTGSITVANRINEALTSLQPGNTPTLNEVVTDFRAKN